MRPAVAPVEAPPAETITPDALDTRLREAVATAFQPRAVAVEIEQLRSTPVSLRDRQATARGRLRLADGAQWLPFEAEAVAPAEEAGVAALAITLEGGDALVAPADLQEAVREHLRRTLAAEFPAQPATVELADVRVRALDGRHLQVDAEARAGFGVEGAARARIAAVWDADGARWRLFDYALLAEEAG